LQWIFSEKCVKYGKQFLVQKRLCTYFSTFFQKLVFRFFQFSQWNYTKTYDYLYSLDSEKSNVYLFYHVLVRKKNFLTTLGLKTSDKKIQIMTIFMANPRLEKNNYCPKIILTYNIWTFICKKMSKTVDFCESEILRWKRASQNSRCVFLWK
jgi:hypothetical protein